MDALIAPGYPRSVTPGLEIIFKVPPSCGVTVAVVGAAAVAGAAAVVGAGAVVVAFVVTGAVVVAAGAFVVAGVVVALEQLINSIPINRINANEMNNNFFTIFLLYSS